MRSNSSSDVSSDRSLLLSTPDEALSTAQAYLTQAPNTSGIDGIIYPSERLHSVVDQALNRLGLRDVCWAGQHLAVDRNILDQRLRLVETVGIAIRDDDFLAPFPRKRYSGSLADA